MEKSDDKSQEQTGSRKRKNLGVGKQKNFIVDRAGKEPIDPTGKEVEIVTRFGQYITNAINQPSITEAIPDKDRDALRQHIIKTLSRVRGVPLDERSIDRVILEILRAYIARRSVLARQQSSSPRGIKVVFRGSGTGLVTYRSSSSQDLVIKTKDSLTPHYVESVLHPYLAALESLQQVCSEVKGEKGKQFVIKAITQNSPIEISLEGAADAIQALKEDIIPWRKKHAKKLAELQAKQLEAEIKQKEAEALEVKARSEKNRAESKLIRANVAKARQEARKMSLENDKLEFELNTMRLQMALDILNRIQPDLTQPQKLAYAVKLLPALSTLTTIEIEPLLLE